MHICNLFIRYIITKSYIRNYAYILKNILIDITI